MHESLELQSPFCCFVFLYTCLLFYLDIKLFEKLWTFNWFCHCVVLGILKKHNIHNAFKFGNVAYFRG